MSFKHRNILITGAAGGIGSCVATRLGAAGASLLLTDFRAEPLAAKCASLRSEGVDAKAVAADVSQSEGRQKLTELAADSGVDCLINVAGVNPFGLFAEQSDAEIDRAIAINTLAPILLCRALLPVLEARTESHIVNVGSVFGSLGYPGFAAYSASKFAIRGFSEALRRELADGPVRVHYVAPRATRTALSTDRISAMNDELKVASDAPEVVAAAIERALSHSLPEVYLGRPERIFGLLNNVLPRLVDRALFRQLPIVRRYASKEYQAQGQDSSNLNMLGA